MYTLSPLFNKSLSMTDSCCTRTGTAVAMVPKPKQEVPTFTRRNDALPDIWRAGCGNLN